MAEAGSSGDPSADARALDVLGNRWALVVVRELLFGPRRLGELQRALDGAGPDVLTTRLRDLADDGVVRQQPGPGADQQYALTELGQRLRPTLVQLARWGHLLPVTQTGQGSVAATLLELQAWFDPDRAGGDLDVLVQLGRDVYRIAGDGTGLTIGTARDVGGATVTRLSTDAATFRAMASGALATGAAIEHRLARLDGPVEPLHALFAASSRPDRGLG